MAEFLVESYVPSRDLAAFERALARVGGAADTLPGAGPAVRFRRRIDVRADDTCLLLYEADSAEAVAEAVRRADVPFERVVEATSSEIAP